jgi:hypothetical protein
MAEYVNVHGQPVGVSAKQAVLRVHPRAWASGPTTIAVDDASVTTRCWLILPAPDARLSIGSGMTEEAAWRAAWSRVIEEEMKRG